MTRAHGHGRLHAYTSPPQSSISPVHCENPQLGTSQISRQLASPTHWIMSQPSSPPQVITQSEVEVHWMLQVCASMHETAHSAEFPHCTLQLSAL